jgi:hypothetical protein
MTKRLTGELFGRGKQLERGRRSSTVTDHPGPPQPDRGGKSADAATGHDRRPLTARR